MGLDDPDHDVDALRALGARGLEHGVGLAHAGGGAEEDLQLPALLPRLLVLERAGAGRRDRDGCESLMARSGYSEDTPGYLEVRLGYSWPRKITLGEGP